MNKFHFFPLKSRNTPTMPARWKPPQLSAFQQVHSLYARRKAYYVHSWGTDTMVLGAKRVWRNARTDEVSVKARRGKSWSPGWWIHCADGSQQVVEKFVDHDDYKRPTWQETGFQVSHLDGDKMEPNLMFRQTLKEYPRPNRHIVYLDSPAGLTTAMLAGEKEWQLHLPHPLLHSKSLQKQWQKPIFQENTRLYESTLYEWLRDEAPAGPFDVGADYCCTWEGNDRCCPQADFRLLFLRHLFPKKNGVLWCTFSLLRNPKHTFKADRVAAEIVELAKSYGYLLHLVKNKQYRRNMVYFMFVSC